MPGPMRRHANSGPPGGGWNGNTFARGVLGRVSHSYDCLMRAIIGLLSIVLAMAIALGSYYYFFKQSVSETGTNPVQAISLTGVQGDLLQIAQAERMYWAQNGTYVDLDKLTSSGSLTMTRTGRDGYTYSVDATDNGFTATATYTAPIPPTTTGALPQHYPTLTIDQTMVIHQTD